MMADRLGLASIARYALGHVRDAVAALAFRGVAQAAGPQPPIRRLPPLRRIAILHFHAIGDLLMATPAIRALARRYPGVRIDVLCGTRGAELLQHNPYVDHVRLQGQPPHRRYPRGLFDLARHLAFLRRGRYDAVVDMTGFVYSAWLTYGSGAPVRVGIAPAGMQPETVWPFYTAAIARDPRRHSIEEYLALVALLDTPADGDAMDLFVGQEARQAVQAWLDRHGLADARLVVLHPGAKWPPKRWSVSGFARLAQWLSHEAGLTPVLTGEQADTPVFEAIQALVGDIPVFDPDLRLLGLGALLERATLFIGNDSGPMHTARAIGIPTIGIFGPTEPHRYGPRGPTAEALLVPIACRPCRFYYTADTCERGHNFCMDGVSVAAVQAAVQRRLQAMPLTRTATVPAPVWTSHPRTPRASRMRRLARTALVVRPICRGFEQLARLRRPLALMLCYHRIVRGAPDQLTPPGLCVRRDDFERQLDFFQRRFRVLAPSALLDEVFAGTLDAPAVGVTFDDGFQDNFDIAYPLLTARGIRAAFFIVADYVGGNAGMWQNRFWRACTLATGATLNEVLAVRAQVPMEPAAQQAFLATLEHEAGLEPRVAEAPFMLTWEEIRCLYAEGHEIGAHTLTHLNLCRCTPAERRRELHGSKAAIEASLGHPVRLFSYPFGDAASWDTDVVAETRAAGFDYALTTIEGTVTPQGDRWAIPRICISRDDGLDLLQLKRLAPAYIHHLLQTPAWTGRRGHHC